MGMGMGGHVPAFSERCPVELVESRGVSKSKVLLELQELPYLKGFCFVGCRPEKG